MLISPTMAIGTSQTVIGQHQPDNREFMRVLLGEVSRSLQRTAQVFSAGQGGALFDNPLASQLFGQLLAEKLTEQLAGRPLSSTPDNVRSNLSPDQVPTPDQPAFDPFFAPLSEGITPPDQQGGERVRFLPFLYHDR